MSGSIPRGDRFGKATAAVPFLTPDLLTRSAPTDIAILHGATLVNAILFEAYLSFLGAGTPPDIPSWGNIMAQGRAYVQQAFWFIAFPGAFLALTVLAINLLGDGLRDRLEAR